MKHYQFSLLDPQKVEEIQFLLSEAGLSNIYTVEDDAQLLIGGFSLENISPPTGATLHLSEDATIDWKEQWNTFSPFSTGGDEISCSLKAFGGPDEMLTLVAGPGFGDLSHPTTQLMLQAMSSYLPTKSVVDVGCGSGVLSVAASIMGAENIYAFDIDEQAVLHTESNLARQEHTCSYLCETKAPDLINESLILCNMTFQEMKCALKGLDVANSKWLLSGIRREQREEFLHYLAEQGLTPLNEESLDDWLLFEVE